jgi:hypothetical protein
MADASQSTGAPKPSDPLVSVVVEGTTDPSGKIMHKTINSLLAQTYPHDRIELVFMDASQDGSIGKHVAKIWPNAVVVPAHDLGYYEMKNVGAQKGSGDIVAFVDSDVTWNPEWIESAVGNLSGLPSYSAVVGLTRYAPGWFSNVGTVSQFGHHWFKYATSDYDNLLGVTANNFALRRQEFLDVRYRFTQFRQGMDMVLACDLQRRGGNVRLIPELRATHKWGWSKIWEHPRTALNVGRGLTTAGSHCEWFLHGGGQMIAHASQFGVPVNIRWMLGGSRSGTSALVAGRFLIFVNYYFKTRRALDAPAYQIVPAVAFLGVFYLLIGAGALANRFPVQEEATMTEELAARGPGGA